MRILLIGGSGFIGTPLSRELAAGDHEVAILHRGNAPSSQSGIRHIRGDRHRLTESFRPLKDFAPEVIVDLVLSAGEQARLLMQLAGVLRARVVALSSMDVYRAWGVIHRVESGPLEPLPITEDSPLRTTRKLYTPEATKAMQGIFTWLSDDYDKISVEEEVLRGPVPGTILRLPMVYGPGDPLHRCLPVVKRVMDGRPAMILPEDFAAWRGPRGYVENVAHAIALAALSDRAAGRVFNISEEPALSELEWRSKLARELGWTGEFVVLPPARAPKHLRVPFNAAQHVVASSDRIRAELGFHEVVAPDESIRRTLSWEVEHPPNFTPPEFDYQAEDEALKVRAG